MFMAARLLVKSSSATPLSNFSRSESVKTKITAATRCPMKDLIASDGGLKNVVVYIEAAPPGKPVDIRKENFLYNDGCRYTPRVMAMQLGERLRVKSNDPKLHVPHAYLGERTVFNLSLPFRTPPSTQPLKFARRGCYRSSVTPMPGCWVLFMSSIIRTSP